MNKDMHEDMKNNNNILIQKTMSKQVLKRVSPHTSVWVDEEDETMNNKKQSSVEWLYERLEVMIPRTALYNIDKKQYFEQAKAMHKEEITDAYIDGHSTWGENTNAENYYNETFGGNNE